MNWDVPPPPPPPSDHVAPDTDVHEFVVPAEERDEHHTWVDLDTGVVHLALPSVLAQPPERFGPAWEPEPRSQEQE
jgi:hypothetical protein